MESLHSYIASDIYGGARAGALGIPPSLKRSKFFFARIDVPQREMDEVLGEFPVQRMMGTYPAKGSKFESGANQIQQHAWRHASEQPSLMALEFDDARVQLVHECSSQLKLVQRQIIIMQ